MNSRKRIPKCLFHSSWFFSVFVKFLKSSLPSLITKDLKMRSGRGDGWGKGHPNGSSSSSRQSWVSRLIQTVSLLPFLLSQFSFLHAKAGYSLLLAFWHFLSVWSAGVSGKCWNPKAILSCQSCLKWIPWRLNFLGGPSFEIPEIIWGSYLSDSRVNSDDLDTNQLLVQLIISF